MSGDLPGRSRQDGGTITPEQDDVDGASVLKLTQRTPPRYEQILKLPFTMTIGRPDSRREPLVLVTKPPALLVGQFSQYPPPLAHAAEVLGSVRWAAA
ncbi:hypothetical protein [Amycolatopsis sp. cmx-4-61]|uniref:hypothetical protein n=1 Tax=Amycolatopsis sp. cmx-4-61 TaxID=2790937 RepID=UPI003978D714